MSHRDTILAILDEIHSDPPSDLDGPAWIATRRLIAIERSTQIDKKLAIIAVYAQLTSQDKIELFSNWCRKMSRLQRANSIFCI